MNELYSPNQLLGQLGAIKTFTENFPMDILDAPNLKPYTSIFDFLIDVLKQFDIDIYTIADEVISKVFEVQSAIDGGIETVYKKIDDLNTESVSEFIDKLESAVKDILLNILVGLSSCDANPFIKSEYLDKHLDSLNGNWAPYLSTYGIPLNKNQIDLFNSLSVNPFSKEGKFYYNAECKSRYYQKISSEEEVYHEGDYTAYTCNKFSRIMIEFCGYHEDYANENLYVNDEFVFKTENTLPTDLNITIEYTDPLNDESEITPQNTYTQEVTIRAGEKYSETSFISPDLNGKKQFIRSIRFSSGNESSERGIKLGDTWAYLDKAYSETVINYWESKGNFSFNNVLFGSLSNCPTEQRSGGHYVLETVYRYVEFDGVGHDCYLMNYFPDQPTESDPEYIEYFDGLDENSANKTYDMNTFLWYIFHHECREEGETQAEVNKNMWDSRVTARKNGIARNNTELWNDWYNSKTDGTFDPRLKPYETNDTALHISGCTDEFLSPLYPILQFYKNDESNNIVVNFASQTYYKPNWKPSDSNFVRENIRMNSTIFKFNKDYLQNITIFNPKMILFNMFNGLLNGALSAAMGVHVDPYREEVKTKLSTAIKKYIEAEDMEVDDCYFKFSNDEFNEMLRKTILNRYQAATNSDDDRNATRYDAEGYMKKIDSVNFSASAVGQSDSIMKILTEVSSEGYEEGYNDYGLSLSTDKGFFERILWSLTMPIVECIFTPQILLLFYINFYVLGLTTIDDAFGNQNEKLLNFVFNKLFNIIKSIVKFIKDMVAKMLLEFFFKIGAERLLIYLLRIYKEKIEFWLITLKNALAWLRLFKFNSRKEYAEIDDVDYADIENVQNKPEIKSNC